MGYRMVLLPVTLSGP